MTEQERLRRITRLVMEGADILRYPRRPKDVELHALVDAGRKTKAASTTKAAKQTVAAGSGGYQYRSHLDAGGVRRWKDAAGREVRYADLPAEIRRCATEERGAVRYAAVLY
jgi:hypothetical protein